MSQLNKMFPPLPDYSVQISFLGCPRTHPFVKKYTRAHTYIFHSACCITSTIHNVIYQIPRIAKSAGSKPHVADFPSHSLLGQKLNYQLKQSDIPFDFSMKN